MILKLGLQHQGLKLYKICINDDPGLTNDDPGLKKTSSSLKPLGHSESNFTWSIPGMGE